jgi:hypothetical protein
MVPTVVRLSASVSALSRPLRRAALAAALAGGVALGLFWLGPLRDGTPPAPAPPLAVPVSPLATVPVPADEGAVSRLAAVPAPADGSAAWSRRIVRQAALDLELEDVDAAVARLTDLVEASGGYVADTQVHGEGTATARATISAYVPASGFGRALHELERFGRPTARRVTGQDVSEEFVDLEARVRNLERHEAQLLGFMGRAQKVADLVSLESELARVRGEIERHTGRIRFLRARSEMAGIRLNLLRAGGPADARLAGAGERIRLAFAAGWKAAFDVAVGLAAMVAQLSPLALAAAVAWGLYRRVRRQPVRPL